MIIRQGSQGGLFFYLKKGLWFACILFIMSIIQKQMFTVGGRMERKEEKYFLVHADILPEAILKNDRGQGTAGFRTSKYGSRSGRAGWNEPERVL